MKEVYQRVKQAQVWEEPKKAKALEKLLGQLSIDGLICSQEDNGTLKLTTSHDESALYSSSNAY